jgi:hypothetical protein
MALIPKNKIIKVSQELSQLGLMMKMEEELRVRHIPMKIF